MFSRKNNKLTQENVEKLQLEIGQRDLPGDTLDGPSSSIPVKGKGVTCEDGSDSDVGSIANVAGLCKRVDENCEAILFPTELDGVLSNESHISTSTNSCRATHEPVKVGNPSSTTTPSQGYARRPHPPLLFPKPQPRNAGPSAVAYDLPGPGRGIDRIYARAGRSITSSRPDKSPSHPSTSTGPLCSLSQVSLSTTATKSDLPGPGRALEALYSRAGRILEEFVNLTAHRCGFGPFATSRRLSEYVLTDKNGRQIYGKGVFGLVVKQVEVVEKGWMKILRYLEHGTYKTRMTAMAYMIQLFFTVAALWNTRPRILNATLIALHRGAENIERHSDYFEEIDLVRMLTFQLSLLFIPCTSEKICVEVMEEDMIDGERSKGDGVVLYDTKALQQMLSDPMMVFVIPGFMNTPIYHYHLSMGVDLLTPPRPAKLHGERLKAMVPLARHAQSMVKQNWKGMQQRTIYMGCSYDSDSDTTDDEESLTGYADGGMAYGTGWDQGWFLDALRHDNDSDSDV